jgi:hypothetical protein
VSKSQNLSASEVETVVVALWSLRWADDMHDDDDCQDGPCLVCKALGCFPEMLLRLEEGPS